MTIYTTANLVTKNGQCAEGVPKTAQCLAEAGLTHDSKVSIQTIYHAMGLEDALFSLNAVCKGCEVERDYVLSVFMHYLLNGIESELFLLPSDYSEGISSAFRQARKRCEGVKNEALLTNLSNYLTQQIQAEASPSERYLLDALRCYMAVDKDDAVVATHATIAFCKAMGVKSKDNAEVVRNMLRKRFETLLGAEARP